MGNFLQDLDNLIYAAIEESFLEDRLHAVLVCLLTAFKDTLHTDARTTISCSIQARTVDRRLYDEFQSLRAFLTTIPDGGLLLHLRTPGLEPCKRTRSLMQFEVKRLLVVKKLEMYTDANRFTAWNDFELVAGEFKSIFTNSIPQLLLQGFCALHTYQGQNTVYIAHLVGIYCTLLQFNRPQLSNNLPSLPRNANHKPSTKAQKPIDEQIPEYKVGDATIAATLFPQDKLEHHPKIVLVAEPIVSWDDNGNIEITNACRYLLSLARDQAAEWLLGSEPSVIFDLPPNEPNPWSAAPDNGILNDYEEYIDQWFTMNRRADVFLSDTESEASLDSELDSPFVPTNSQDVNNVLRSTPPRTRAVRQAELMRLLNVHDPFHDRSPSPGQHSASLV